MHLKGAGGWPANTVATLALRRHQGDEELQNNDHFCALLDQAISEWVNQHDTRRPQAICDSCEAGG
jgi:hypothetical protein